MFSLGSLYGEEDDWNRACQCYEKALQAMDARKILTYASDFGKPVLQHLPPAGRVPSSSVVLLSYSGCAPRLTTAHGRADVLGNLGDLYQMQGDLSRAEECYQSVVPTAAGAVPMIWACWATAWALAALSSVYQLTGNVKTSAKLPGSRQASPGGSR